MPRKYTRSLGRVGKDRLTVWFTWGISSTTSAAASAAVITNTLNAAALAFAPFTIIRTRGILHVSSDQTGALENYQVQMGFAVVSAQAVAIGVTAVPTPDTDRGSGLWFVYEEVYGRFTFISGVGALEGGHTRYFDSKAMRKVDSGDQVISVLENSSLSNGTVSIMAGRMLIKTN